MEGLIIKHNKDRISQVKKINYYCYTTPNNNHNNNENNSKRFSFKPLPKSKDDDHVIEVNIDPVKHFVNELSAPFETCNEKWFMNLSQHNIPDKVKRLLQFGHNFSLPMTNPDNSIIQLIKNIENNIIKLNDDTQNTIRNWSIPLLHKLKNSSHIRDNMDSTIMNLMTYTKKFIKSNPNLIFTRADKGNITVALNKLDYINRIEDIFKDNETYIKINKDPLKKLTSDIRCLLTRWKSNGYISKSAYSSIYCSDGNLPRAYGLPKVHKPGLSFRIIISSLDSPSYQFANFLHRLISQNINKPFSHIDNSFELIKKLEGTCLCEEHDLVSLDATSLFTNIPMELAIKSLTDRWGQITRGTTIPKEEFMIGVRMVMESTFFTFNNKIYKQKFGTPMGSPLSPIIADIVMEDIESQALKVLSCRLPIYYRYVDDIMLAIPHNKTTELLDTFNSFHPRLKFTIEIGGNKLDFLDVTVYNENNLLEFDIYRKPTFSGRTLNFHSKHPLSQKKGVIMSMVDRMFLLSHPKHHQKNINVIIEIFMSNGYPLDFIMNTIFNRIKKLINNKTKKQIDIQNNEEVKRWFVMPFIPNLTEKFQNIANFLKSKLAFFSLHKLDRVIRAQKDMLPVGHNKNVVYKLSCKDCNMVYVGQTKRRLNTRIEEHMKDINKKTTANLSVISEHRLEFKHEFDWNNPSILDREDKYYRRLIAEMVYIKMHNNTINLQTDTELLQHSYCEILNRIQKKQIIINN